MSYDVSPSASHVRKIYGKYVHTCNTVKNVGDVKRMCERALKEEWRFKQETLKYIRSLMLSMKQEDLILELDTLTYHELRMAVGVGVPGDAQQFARDKLKEMKRKARESVENSTNFAYLDVTIQKEQEANKDGSSGVQTPQGQ